MTRCYLLNTDSGYLSAEGPRVAALSFSIFHSNVLDGGKGSRQVGMSGFIPGWSKCKRRIPPKTHPWGKRTPPFGLRAYQVFHPKGLSVMAAWTPLGKQPESHKLGPPTEPTKNR